MSEEFNNDERTRLGKPTESSRRVVGDEIPRHGYDRQRGEAGTPRREIPPLEPEITTPPPVYGDVPPPPPAFSSRRGPRPGTPPPPIRGKSKERVPRDSGLYLPWWSLVVLIVFVGAAAFGLLFAVMNMGGATLGNQTPQVIIVTSAIQPTPVGQNPGMPTALPSAEPTSQIVLPTLIPTNTALPGGCLLNEEVVVYNTGTQGLNIRSEPRLAGEHLWTAPEGHVFRVLDGPQFFDDIEWCYIEGITNQAMVGWASLEFLIAKDAVEQ